MPIKWSALKVSEAADMIEEYFNQAVEPLEQIKVVAQEARHISNLPEYISQYLVRIEGEVERAIGGSQFGGIRMERRRTGKSVREGGTVIDYNDEDPEIRRAFEEELRKKNLRCTLKPVVYRTDPFKF